jgi:hypothetical protein
MNTSEWFFQATFLHCFNSRLIVSLLCHFWLRSLNYGFIPLSFVRIMKKRFYVLRRFDHYERFHPFHVEGSSAAAWSWQTPRLCQIILMIQFVFKVYRSRNQLLLCHCIFTRFGLRTVEPLWIVWSKKTSSKGRMNLHLFTSPYIYRIFIGLDTNVMVEFLSVLAHDSWLS